MEAVKRAFEYVFIFTSSVSNFERIYTIGPLVAWLYLIALLAYAVGLWKLQPAGGVNMFTSPFAIVNCFLFWTLQLSKHVNGQTLNLVGPDGTRSSIGGLTFPTQTPTLNLDATPTAFESVFTVPSWAANAGATLIPNIEDSEAVDAQTVYPGYHATHVIRTALGLAATSTLAGPACNVYGDYIETLNLTVELQSANRLAVRVAPEQVDASNSTFYKFPDHFVTQLSADVYAESTNLASDLSFVGSNDPTFSVCVHRTSTGDALHSTVGTNLFFEDRFVGFASALPSNDHLCGLGETIDGFSLGNSNTRRTIYAAGTGDTIDANIYGSHAFYLETGYYEVDSTTINRKSVTNNETSSTAFHVSYQHGVYNRNAHPVNPPFGLPVEPGIVVSGYPEGFILTNATEAETSTSLSACQAPAYPTGSSAAESLDHLTTTPTPSVRCVNHPPHVINSIQGDLAVHAISLIVTHAGGTRGYDVHKLLGSYMQHTMRFFKLFQECALSLSAALLSLVAADRLAVGAAITSLV